MESKYRVSLEVAQQLKEAGYPQEGCDAYWINGLLHIIEVSSYDLQCPLYIAAPCVGALGEALPKAIDACMLCSQQITGHTFIFYGLYNGEHRVTEYYGDSDNEADARALCWIELKKQGLI